MRQDNFPNEVSPSLGLASTIQKTSNRQPFDSEAEVSFNLTNNNDDSMYQADMPGAHNDNFSHTNKNVAVSIRKQYQINGSNDQKKDPYQDEYERVKLNLFKCLGDEDQDAHHGDGHLY